MLHLSELSAQKIDRELRLQRPSKLKSTTNARCFVNCPPSIRKVLLMNKLRMDAQSSFERTVLQHRRPTPYDRSTSLNVQNRENLETQLQFCFDDGDIDMVEIDDQDWNRDLWWDEEESNM
ncbi:hypothetical protein HK102_014095 [Quaeritorhiza haematococci]|nr:hypothetical protein HK102_014095 [Quaeritorhiza haematococci]